MNASGPEIDAEYRQLREECGLARPDTAFLRVEGPDAAEYLHSQVTNEIEALDPGDGCHCCLLDRKGHIQADLRVLRTGDDELLIICDPAVVDCLERHLTTYSIGRDVTISRTDVSLISLIGPATLTVTGVSPGEEFASVAARVDGVECLMVATASGVDVLTPAGDVERVAQALLSSGCEEVSAKALEILRIEAGRPRFESELAAGPMPAEAGLVDRTVSFTKGCYIGQEPVARLHYKGRPNRFLRGLRFAASVEADDSVQNSERQLGTVSSVALSPVEGWIGLSILRREAEPGQTVEVITDSGPVEAEVVELPFPAGVELE